MKKVEREIAIRRAKNGEEFLSMALEQGLVYPYSEDVSILAEPIRLKSGKVIPNSIGIHPLEGFDGTKEGAPTETVFRRYERYARGGAGLIWYEAIAISMDGRCNPLQMVINEQTTPELKKLMDHADRCAIEEYGRKPYNVLQLTHSGRRSVDDQYRPSPLAAVPNPYLDEHNSVDGSKGKLTIATDEKIEQIVAEFIHGAELAAEAGFDAVDIKICHEYILRELLSAYTRPGKYGGSFENRSRAIFEIVRGIRERVGDRIDICVRMNAYDCIPYPYGWGMVKEEGVMAPDLTEPKKLVRMLYDEGIEIFNVSTMMPRYSPYGPGMLAEHGEGSIRPFTGVSSLLQATRELKAAVPEARFMCTGLCWLDVFGANVGAGGKKDGWFDIAGFGRQAFAYPEFANDILTKGGFDRNKVCLTCDMCYDLMTIGHTITGCACRDPLYRDLYRQAVAPKKQTAR